MSSKVAGWAVLTVLGVELIAVVVSFGAQLVALPLHTRKVDFDGVMGLASSVFISIRVVLSLRSLWTREVLDRQAESMCAVGSDRMSHPFGK